jgi:hypothetical protein
MGSTDPDSGSTFSKAMEIHTLELPKLPEHGGLSHPGRFDTLTTAQEYAEPQ